MGGIADSLYTCVSTGFTKVSMRNPVVFHDRQILGASLRLVTMALWRSTPEHEQHRHAVLKLICTSFVAPYRSNPEAGSSIAPSEPSPQMTRLCRTETHGYNAVVFCGPLGAA